MFSVELVPDAATERAVTDDCARLQSAGLPNAGRNKSLSNRPHVTLAVRERVDPAALAGVEALLPLPLELGGLVLFPHARRVVVARQVVVTTALLYLHAVVAERIGPPEPQYANTAPGRWTPHLTLARSMPVGRMAEVLAAIESPSVLGQAVGLRVWDATEKVITTIV